MLCGCVWEHTPNTLLSLFLLLPSSSPFQCPDVPHLLATLLPARIQEICPPASEWGGGGWVGVGVGVVGTSFSVSHPSVVGQ